MTEKKREPKVFVSYSAPDAEWATSFARDLAQEGFDVRPGDWSAGSRTGHGAGWTPASGENWAQAMAEDLRDSDVVILVLGAGGLDSPWVLFELGVAMAGAKAVVPIVSDGVDALTLPVPLQSVVFVRKESPEATAARVASGLLKAS